nr:ATP-dependent exonuclease [Neisseria shayeganii]
MHRLRPLQNPHLRRISALCAARSLAYLYDMFVPRGFLAFMLAALLRLELYPHLRSLQRSQVIYDVVTKRCGGIGGENPHLRR